MSVDCYGNNQAVAQITEKRKYIKYMLLLYMQWISQSVLKICIIPNSGIIFK